MKSEIPCHLLELQFHFATNNSTQLDGILTLVDLLSD